VVVVSTGSTGSGLSGKVGSSSFVQENKSTDPNSKQVERILIDVFKNADLKGRLFSKLKLSD